MESPTDQQNITPRNTQQWEHGKGTVTQLLPHWCGKIAHQRPNRQL